MLCLKFVQIANYSFTAFEGLAHPYKENIVKFGNESILNKPEVQQAFKEAKEAEASA